MANCQITRGNPIMQNCSRCFDRISKNFYCLDVFWMMFLAGTFSDDFPIFVQWKNGCGWLPERVLALFSFGMVEFFFRKKDGLPVHLSCIPKVLSCFISSISLNLEVYLRASTRAWSELTSQRALKLWNWAALSKFFLRSVTGLQMPRSSKETHGRCLRTRVS